MLEFRLTFAQKDPEGRTRTDIAKAIGERLAVAYGGFTMVPAEGGYIMSNGELLVEPVWVFDVAVSDDYTPNEVRQYATMAAEEIKREMTQESVYFRNVTGQVELL